jgi:hypothetical protein
LEQRLQSFIERYDSDPLRRVARAYVALILIERGKPQDARSTVKAIRSGHAGNTQDLATLVEGAALSREGQYEAAIQVLMPLCGKMLDGFAQTLSQEVLVEASVGAHRWFEAVAYMDQWLRLVDAADREAVRKRVDELLAKFPSDALLYSFLAIQNSAGSRVYGKGIRVAIADRLTKLAASGADPSLTQGVVQATKSGGSLGEAGTYFFRLATLGAAAPRVSGATLGIAAPQYSNMLRERSSEAVSGVVSVVGPSSGTSVSDERAGLVPVEGVATVIQEVKVDDPKAMQQAMRDLLRDGASLIIAGFDEASAKAAAAFAEANSVPVLLLSSPGQVADGARFSFVLGTSDEERDAVIVQAAQAAQKRIFAQVGYIRNEAAAQFEPCERRAPKAGDGRFPIAAWKKDDVSALLLTGPAWCSRDVLEESSALRFVPSLYCGLDGAWACASLAASVGAQWASAGSYGEIEPGNQSISSWLQSHSSKPSWFAALGRDAAVLASAVLRTLPADETSDLEEIGKRHALVQRGLASQPAELWTTDAPGFEGGRLIRRKIQIQGHRR